MFRRILCWLSSIAFGLALLMPLSASAQTSDKPFTNEQLDQMLAQIALYPDSLLSQVLMAATYPDEFAAAVAWSKGHPDVKGDDAVTMVANEPWDPSVASLVAFPEALITLGDKPDYVRSLGDAFLAQPEDVMDSVQRLRAAAQKAGNLKTNEQIKVASAPAPAPTTTTVVVQQAAPPTQVIVIEPAQPSVVYVPAYNPTVVYGPWWYPTYPPYYYPPPPGYWWSRTIATGIAWGIGIGISNALWGGFDWGRRDVNINVNRYNNIHVNKRIDVDVDRARWNHDPGHRGKVPYKGGDATRQKLEKKHDAGKREQFRGKDAARDAGRDSRGGSGRDASREQAAQAMQQRTGAADKAADRSAAKAKAPAATGGTGADREAARRKAQDADRDAARQRAQQASKDSALKGVNDRQPKQQVDRGAASQKAAQQRPASTPGKAAGGGAAKAAGAGGGAKRDAGDGGGKARNR